MGLIGHLRQVLDVDVQQAGLVVHEGFQLLKLALDLRLQALEVGGPVPAQAAARARARDIRADELMGHRQQVVQGQYQHASQLDGQQFLGRVERGG